MTTSDDLANTEIALHLDVLHADLNSNRADY